MRKIVFIWIALLATALNSYADDKVTFTASAPDAVAVGDQFRLSYTVNTQNVRDFRAPSVKGFDVLMGPSRSYSRQNINGNVTENLTFTYWGVTSICLIRLRLKCCLLMNRLLHRIVGEGAKVEEEHLHQVRLYPIVTCSLQLLSAKPMFMNRKLFC